MPTGDAYSLDSSHDIYRLAIDSVQDYAILMLTTDGTIQSWNQGTEKIMGYSEAEITGQHFQIFYTPGDRRKLLPRVCLRQAQDQGHAQHEGWQVKKDKSLFWAHTTFSAIYDTARNLRGFSTITRDLTEQKKAEKEKEKIEQILNSTNETARIGTWEVDMATDMVIWSRITKSIHEVPDDFQLDIISAINFIKEGESRDHITGAFHAAVSHGTPYDLQVVLVTASGREIWCRAIGHAEFTHGKCTRVFGIFQDIDKQKRTEIELQISEEQFRNSFDLSGIGMALVSPDAVPIRVNKKLCEILGYTPAEFYSRSIFDITYPDDIAMDAAYARQLLDGEINHYQMTKRYLHKNGSIVWSHLTVSLVRNADRHPVHFVSEVEDITEKKKAEDELRRVNDELTAIFNSGTRVSIISADLQGIITHFNKGAEAMLGYTAEEIIGKASPDFLHVKEELAARMEEMSRQLGRPVTALEALRAKAKVDGYEASQWSYRRKDGSTFPVQLVISSIRDENNKVIGYLGIATDITQIREAEASIRKYALLEAKNKEMEQFTFLASHDLLEPLQTVSSFAGLLHEEYHDRLDEHAAKYIEFISGSTSRMMDLVKGLLHYSRIGKEKKLEMIDCDELVRNVVADLGLSISESGAEVTIGELPVLLAYRLEMNLLFQNLITNGLKFRDKDRPLSIHISAERMDGIWTFCVSDTGIGIAHRNREKIFSMFQRLHDRHEYEGTGIGLAYCKKIVELHNGAIWVESEPGSGSTFKFTIQT